MTERLNVLGQTYGNATGINEGSVVVRDSSLRHLRAHVANISKPPPWHQQHLRYCALLAKNLTQALLRDLFGSKEQSRSSWRSMKESNAIRIDDIDIRIKRKKDSPAGKICKWAQR